MGAIAENAASGLGRKQPELEAEGGALAPLMEEADPRRSQSPREGEPASLHAVQALGKFDRVVNALSELSRGVAVISDGLVRGTTFARTLEGIGGCRNNSVRNHSQQHFKCMN